MKRTITKVVPLIIKVSILLVFIIGIILPTNNITPPAKAVNQSSIDAQQGCSIDDSSDDEGGKKGREDTDDSDSGGRNTGDAGNLSGTQKKSVQNAYEFLNKDYGELAVRVAGI